MSAGAEPRCPDCGLSKHEGQRCDNPFHNIERPGAAQDVQNADSLGANSSKRAWSDAENDAWLDGQAEANDRWREAVRIVRGRYPEDVFPWPSDTVEGKVARMIRINCNEIIRIADEAEHG